MDDARTSGPMSRQIDRIIVLDVAHFVPLFSVPFNDYASAHTPFQGGVVLFDAAVNDGDADA